MPEAQNTLKNVSFYLYTSKVVRRNLQYSPVNLLIARGTARDTGKYLLIDHQVRGE